MSEILGKKIGMTQTFDQKGEVVPVTVIQAGPCLIAQRMTKEKNGYDAIQVGFEKSSKKKKGFRFLREFRVSTDAEYQTSQELRVDQFKVGDLVRVTGTSKGKGFQGVIKKHGKAGGPASHGSRFHRTTGSIGQRTSPGKVFKNMKLPGHLGDDRVTVRNLEVTEIRLEENIICLRGAVPGGRNALVMIRKEYHV